MHPKEDLTAMAVPGDSIRFIGISETIIKDGSLNNPITIGGKKVHVKSGDLVLYHYDQFIFDGMKWICIT